MKIPVTLLGSTDQKYERFILPFMATSLWCFPDSKVEVISMRPPAKVREENAEGIRTLARHFGNDRFRISPMNALLDGTGFRASTVRMLQEPTLRSEYTYMVDIDIFYLIADLSGHLDYMEKLGLPYSNMVRNNTTHLRITGMHFMKTEEYYDAIREYVKRRTKLMRKTGQQLLDERELYRMCKRCIGLPDHDKHERYRPVPGYHVSPNRAPAGSNGVPGWGIGRKDMRERWLELRKTRMWKEVTKHFHPDALQRVRTINEIVVD